MQTQNNKIPLQSEESGDCLSAKELVNRHLLDKDHKISDEDLEKVALDCTDDMEDTTAELTPNNVPASRSENESKKDDEEEKDVIITPLDVIS